MTSTITAESRAKAIVQRIAGSDPWADDALDEMTALIAAAIRDAENEAIERAAAAVRTSIGQWTGGPLRLEAEILALKSPSPKEP